MLSLHGQISDWQLPAVGLLDSKYVQFSLELDPHPRVTRTYIHNVYLAAITVNY